MIKIKLPKWVKKVKGGFYSVGVYSKKYKTFNHLGTYATIKEAIKKRDKYIFDNKNDITEGVYPRGITFYKKTNKYHAFICINKNNIYIGQFDKLEDAVNYRVEFVKSLL